MVIGVLANGIAKGEINTADLANAGKTAMVDTLKNAAGFSDDSAESSVQIIDNIVLFN